MDKNETELQEGPPHRNILRCPFIKMSVTVLCGLICCCLAVSVVSGTAAVASALQPDLGETSGCSWPVAPTHGNVDVNGNVGQGQAVAPWTSSQLPTHKEKGDREIDYSRVSLVPWLDQSTHDRKDDSHDPEQEIIRN